MRLVLVGWGLLLIGACSSGPSSVPIDQIPPDKKLVDLSGGEKQGVCDWATGLAKQKLAGATCGGNPINVNGCFTIGPDCPATVSQYQMCLPNLLDRWASDPCQILSLAYSMSDLVAYVNGTPGCDGQGTCATSMP